MCGSITLRHATYSFPGVIERDSLRPGEGFGMNPRTDIRPTEQLVIIREGSDHHRKAELLTWGRQTPRRPRPLFNARAETVDELPTFAEAFKLRRCLVPADGWYEWTDVENRRLSKAEADSRGLTTSGKQRWFIHYDDDRLVYLAALYGNGYHQDKETKEWRPVCCSVIITTEANETVAATGHDRMPVPVSADHCDAWLDPAYGDAKALKPILGSRSCPGLAAEKVRGPIPSRCCLVT